MMRNETSEPNKTNSNLRFATVVVCVVCRELLPSFAYTHSRKNVPFRPCVAHRFKSNAICASSIKRAGRVMRLHFLCGRFNPTNASMLLLVDACKKA